MIIPFYWKYVAIVLALSMLSYSGYNKIYRIGYNKAAEEYGQIIAKYELDLNKRIADVEYTSVTLIDTINKSNKAFSKDVQVILKSIKDKPLYTVSNDGKCSASAQFVDSYNSVINRANKHD